MVKHAEQVSRQGGEKIALITGAAGGLGLVIAERLARDGFCTHITSRSEQRLSAATERAATLGLTLHCHVVPTANEATVDRVVTEVYSRAPAGSVLVNNAAQRFHAALHETPLTAWEEVMAAGLTSAFLWTRAAIPLFVSAGGGRIINMAGRSGEMGESGRVAIVAAKAGLMGLTRATAREYAASNVTCNSVSPSAVESESVAAAVAESEEQQVYFDRRRREIPMGRFALPDEVAGAVSWLAGPDGSFVTGQVIRVNGGVYA